MTTSSTSARSFDTHLPNIADQIANLGGTPAGPPYGRYHEFGPDQVDIEIGMPVGGAGREPASAGRVRAGEVGGSELPGGAVR